MTAQQIVTHGYGGHQRGCRCEDCKFGNSDYQRRWRLRNPETYAKHKESNKARERRNTAIVAHLRRTGQLRRIMREMGL